MFGSALEMISSMDEMKICFITCVSDEELYAESLLYLRQLEVPENMKVQFLPVRGAASMADGYNRAMKMSEAKYKVYLHQDVLLVKRDFIWKICTIFQQPAIGLIGLIGCKKLTASGVWWDGEMLYGRVLHAPEPESIVPSICEEVTGEFCEAAVVDGIILATQYDLSWRADIFDGWHFYDTAQCLEFRRHGYTVVIPQQKEDWCIHLAKQKPLRLVYWDYQKRFLQEYGFELLL